MKRLLLPRVPLRALMRLRNGGILAAAVALLATGGARLHAQAPDSKGAVAPNKLWAAQTSPSQITLNWGHVHGAVSYRVFCMIGDAAPRLLGTISGPASRSPAEAALRTLSYIVRVVEGAAHRCAVQAVTAKGLASPQVPFNEVVPAGKRAISPTVAPPATVTATESADGEITLTWSEVPGATAYVIGRSVAPDGLRILCQLCPNTPSLTDRDVLPGARHVYTVAAVTPAGVSRRTTSNEVTPGSDGEGDAGTGGVVASDSSANSKRSLKGPANVTAVLTTPTSVTVSWLPTPQEGAAGEVTYVILRSIGGRRFEPLARMAGSMVNQFVDNLTPIISQHAQALLRITYQVQAIDSKSASTPVATNELVIDPAKSRVNTGGTTTTTTTTTTTGTPSTCKLAYQRADNMWAALGRPDGNLGVETLSVPAGQTRIFTTDWKYEKKRNDGTNYYGSHLRVATNQGQRPMTLGLRASAAGSGMPITLSPGETRNFRHDLMEATCR